MTRKNVDLHSIIQSTSTVKLSTMELGFNENYEVFPEVIDLTIDGDDEWSPCALSCPAANQATSSKIRMRDTSHGRSTKRRPNEVPETLGLI